MSGDRDDLLAIAGQAPSLEEKRAALLDAWRRRRLVRTAELITRMSGVLARRGPPKGRPRHHADWLLVAAKHDPSELDGLLADVVTFKRALSLERVESLASWPADPRIAIGLLDLVRSRPFTSVPNRPFWTRVFREITSRADHSTLPTVLALLQRRGVASFDDYIDSKLRTLEAAIERRPRVEEFQLERAALDAIAHSLERESDSGGQKREADFLAEIYASPLDDGLREVFSDWLIERGELRGELIALQMARARGAGTVEGAKREKALLLEHARAWMGPLEPAVSTRFRFERGFLHTCKIAWRNLVATPGLITHPAWATVREYELDPEGEAACDAWLDHMIALASKRR